MPPYDQGQQAALDQYGVDPQQQQQWYAPKRKKKRSWVPAALAAGAVGLGAYAHLRTPKFAPGGLGELQQQASRGGFRRVVDVPYHDQLKPTIDPDYGPVDRFFWNHQPTVDPHTHEMSLWNKIKFHAMEGFDTIPIAARGNQVRVIGSPTGSVKLPDDQVVWGRHVWPTHGTGVTGASVIHGGTDIEGPLATQQALTNLSQKGKGVEADLLEKHAPGAVPKTIGAHRLPGLVPQQKSPYAMAAHLQERANESFRGDDYFLKPNLGLSSGGEFPSRGVSWADELKKYHKHIKQNPDKAEWIRKSTGGSFSNELTDYLRDNGLYEGWVVDQATRDPSSALVQRRLPGYEGEQRVHIHRGQVIPSHTLDSLLKGHFTEPLTGRSPHSLNKTEQWAQSIVDKLPPEYRQGSFGMDVAKSRHPETGERLRHVLELNPSERGSATLEGGGSGSLYGTVFPTAGQEHYHNVTGRFTAPVAGAVGGLGALGAGGLAYGLTRPTDDEDDKPHPVG